MTKASMIKDIMAVLESDTKTTPNERYNTRRRLQNANEAIVKREWREKVPAEIRYNKFAYKF